MLKTEYHNGTLCVQAGWLFNEAGIMSFEQYKNYVNRKQIKVVRRGCRGKAALVSYQSLREDFRQKIITQYGDPFAATPVSVLERLIVPDTQAAEYYSNYRLEDGSPLPLDRQLEYTQNAMVLNAMHALRNERNKQRIKSGRRVNGSVWETIASAVMQLDTRKYKHNLPINSRRLRQKFDQYIKQGYTCLIHKNFGNINSRIVDEQLENLLLSIYCMSNKPYASWVHEDYLMFIAGAKDVVNMRTGELYDRNDFYDENKQNYITISEATCWNYIRNPKNHAIIEKYRSQNHNYISTIRPHHHREAPNYSLSKISLDDRDLPRKMHNGKRVKAYYAYDVASGVVIGKAYSEKKDANLFIECIRDMFRFITQNGYGVPLEVEVEHHIVSAFKDDLMKAQVVFPFVRFCAAGNSQEKHAEQLNKLKKYGYEKRYQDGIGRFYAKSRTNQTGGERVYDSETDSYILADQTFSFEQLVADDIDTIEKYNNGLHRNQKKHKNKTSMQVLRETLNPNLAMLNMAVLVRYIGEKTITSIDRNMYCQVQYNKYMLPDPNVLRKLAPNNYDVVAYYLPGDNIENVYLYQHDSFICECSKINKYNTAIAERTQADDDAKAEQSKYIAKFDKMVKEEGEKLAKITLLDNIDKYNKILSPKELEDIIVKHPNPEEERPAYMDALENPEEMQRYWAEKALNDL